MPDLPVPLAGEDCQWPGPCDCYDCVDDEVGVVGCDCEDCADECDVQQWEQEMAAWTGAAVAQAPVPARERGDG